jgi:hypothetical protein
VRQTEIAKLEMMTVRLAIRRDVDQIATQLCGADELFHDAAARRECALKSDGAREWSMVEENRDRAL